MKGSKSSSIIEELKPLTTDFVFEREDRELALEYMKNMYGTEILVAEELANSWNLK